MADVTLSSIVKSYGALDVIKGVDLEIKSGEFVVFVGPSGCGKSTLLRMIAGLEDISSGSLYIGGAQMNDVDPSQRGIAMVFQSYALYPHMSVRENMGFALRFAGFSRTEIEARVAAAARILKLDQLMERKPKALSGGQRQRVAIGRAIVRQPDVFLFDEPLSNLDAELRVHMRLEIAQLHKQLKTTMIYVTHDQVEAMTLADKIVVLRNGNVEQVGAPLQLYDNPDNQFVAGFIGSPKMNFIPADYIGKSDRGHAFALFGKEKHLHLQLATTDLRPGARVTIGVRPEHFVPEIEADVTLDVAVTVAENLGSTSYVYANVDNIELIVEQKQRVMGTQNDSMQLGISAAKAMVFAENGQRIR